MRRVFLIREPEAKRDIKSAEMFGDVVVCINRSEGSLSLGVAMNRLRSTLKDYEEGDYILWAGGEWTTLVALGVVLKELHLKQAVLLVWKKLADGTGTYVPRPMAL